jgi:hypothetical protein
MCIYKRKICVYYVIWCAYSHLPLQAYYFCMLRPSARRGKHSAEGQLNSSNVIATLSLAMTRSMRVFVCVRKVSIP